MGAELVNTGDSHKRKFSEIFDEVFPFYLHIGMTPEQFWEQDILLPKFYREKYNLDKKERNFDMWMSGRYYMDALSATVGNLLTKGKLKGKYPEEPYPLTEKENEEQQTRKIQINREKALKRFSERANEVKFTERKEEIDG